MKMAYLQEPKLWTRGFVTLCVANFLVFTAFYFLLPTLPVYITTDLKQNKSMVGLILAMYTLAALLIRPFTGASIDAMGRKTIYLSGLILFALLFNMYIVAETVSLLLILRFIHGLGWGVTTTSGNTAVVDIIPPARRGEGIGIFVMSFTLGMAVGPFVGLLILGEHHYHLLFFSAFLISFTGWLLAMSVKYPKYTPLNGGKIQWSNLFERKSIRVSLNLLIINITYGGVISFVALYGREIGIKNPGLFFLFYAIGVSITRFTSGKLFDKYGPNWLMTVGLTMIAIGFPILALEKNITGFLLSAVIMGFGNGIIGPALQAMVNNMVEPHQRGAANSTFFTALDLGIGIGMILTGALSEMITITKSFLVCSAISIFALLFFQVFVNRHYHKHKIQ